MAEIETWRGVIGFETDYEVSNRGRVRSLDRIKVYKRLDQHLYGWPMIDAIEFPHPIPAVGAQGFWNWS